MKILFRREEGLAMINFLRNHVEPRLRGAVGWGILYTKKVLGSVPSQGGYLGCRLDSWSGCAQKATDWCFNLTVMFLLCALSNQYTHPQARIEKIKIYIFLSSYIQRSATMRKWVSDREKWTLILELEALVGKGQEA